MPNKTLYVREADLPLFEQAQEQLGDSVSSLFAEFLRDRVATLTPVEGKLLELTDQISRKREAIQKERDVPGFIEGEYAEAETYAGRALNSLRAGEIRNAKIFFYAANSYLDWAERDAKRARELGVKLAEMVNIV